MGLTGRQRYNGDIGAGGLDWNEVKRVGAGELKDESSARSCWDACQRPLEGPVGVLLLLLSRFSHVQLCATL